MTPRTFAVSELQCRCGCGLANFHPGFLYDLQALRDALGRPMILTSAARCARHNVSIGGHPRSLHICDIPQHTGQEGALAVDVQTPDAVYRGDLFALAWEYGWSIGWNARRGFLHLDRRSMVGLPRTSFDY